MNIFKNVVCILLITTLGCDTGNLLVKADLPRSLKEVSGTEIASGSQLIWMLNDGGNKANLFGLNTKGKIEKKLKINAKNNDWEDLTSDPKGNLYIGDFGNNLSSRENLTILKVNHKDLKSDSLVEIERISFKYSDQKKYPAKKKQRYFDCEAFFFYNDSLYLFTKSRVKTNFGKTSLYKIPAKKGNHIATLIGSFNTCDDLSCWITSADISNDGTTVALLNHKSVWIFKDFKNDNFFSGNAKEYPFDHESQKEALCFKSDNTLYITDESSHGGGGNLYEFYLY
jgi:hypothetical protein